MLFEKIRLRQKKLKPADPAVTALILGRDRSMSFFLGTGSLCLPCVPDRSIMVLLLVSALVSAPPAEDPSLTPLGALESLR